MDARFEKGGSRGYVTAEAISWHVGRKNSGLVVEVPAGFEFESSVPWIFRWIWSPDDPFFLKAAAVHDYLLEDGWRHNTADTQWFEASLSVGAPRLRAEIALLGMRIHRFVRWGLNAIF